MRRDPRGGEEGDLAFDLLGIKEKREAGEFAHSLDDG
jgi:hypothetical protein